jgi:hypothetical protein
MIGLRSWWVRSWGRWSCEGILMDPARVGQCNYNTIGSFNLPYTMAYLNFNHLL